MRRTRRDPDQPLFPKAAWSRPFASFFPAPFVSETFAIDGRKDDDFAPVWEADLVGTPFWRNGDGYEIRAVADPDFEPDAMLLVSPSGERCGFYAGGQAWVDPPHRGQGLGAEMVLAMTVALGKGPTVDMPSLGFSEAGLVAHRRAWCLAVERAVDAGLDVGAWVVTIAQSMRDDDPLSAAAPGM